MTQLLEESTLNYLVCLLGIIYMGGRGYIQVMLTLCTIHSENVYALYL